jgi:hypothetical protein
LHPSFPSSMTQAVMKSITLFLVIIFLPPLAVQHLH